MAKISKSITLEKAHYKTLDKLSDISSDDSLLEVRAKWSDIYLNWNDKDYVITDRLKDFDYYLTDEDIYFVNKGQIEIDYNYLMYLSTYLGYGNKFSIQDILITKFKEPLVTSDGVEYMSLANYYSAMKTQDYSTRSTIAQLSPFSSLRHWEGMEEYIRPNWLSVRDTVMDKGLQFLQGDASFDVVKLPYIGVLFTDVYGVSLFGNSEEDSYWGISTTSFSGSNILGNKLSSLKYAQLYENIPF